MKRVRRFFLVLLAVIGFLIVSSATVALADEGILILPDGTAKYYQKGKFVSIAVEGPGGVWMRVDTGKPIGKFFEGPQGVKGSDGVWRDPRPTNPAPHAQSSDR